MIQAPDPNTASASGLFLAMDTSGREGSVAVASGSPRGKIEILAQTELQAEEEHASLLVPRLAELLREVGAEPSDLTGVVVGAGPGSFTGVRVGAATAKGMAWALDVQLWAFSSLAAAAVEVNEDPFRPRLVLFDARGDRVYAAAYRVVRDSLETLLLPRAATVGEVLDHLTPPGAIFLGAGALRHRDLLEGAGNRVLPHPAGRPSAGGLLRLLSLTPGATPVEDVSRWEPDYLRESGAERMWKSGGGPRGRMREPDGPASEEDSVRVRLATPLDLAAIAAIESRSFSNPWHPDTFRSLLTRDGVRVLVAEEGEGVLGYAVLWWVLEQGELANLAVREESQRRGIGSKLLDSVISHAMAEGVESLFLEVRVSNEKAARLYSLRGFEQISVRKGYYQNPREDARILVKYLSGEETPDSPEDPSTSGGKPPRKHR